MSRTYRRTAKGQKRSWLPAIWYFHNTGYYSFKTKVDPLVWIKNNPHRARDPNDYFYDYGAPGWWYKETATLPNRRKDRMLCKKIVNGVVDPEEAMFSINRRPRIYW